MDSCKLVFHTTFGLLWCQLYQVDLRKVVSLLSLCLLLVLRRVFRLDRLLRCHKVVEVIDSERRVWDRLAWKLHSEYACIRRTEFEVGEFNCKVHRILQWHCDFQWKAPNSSAAYLGHDLRDLLQVGIGTAEVLEYFGELFDF